MHPNGRHVDIIKRTPKERLDPSLHLLHATLAIRKAANGVDILIWADEKRVSVAVQFANVSLF